MDNIKKNEGKIKPRTKQRRAAPDRREPPTRDYLTNQYIFREHETGQEAFIVKSGQVEIIKSITEDGITSETSLNIIEEGGLFGEMALIDNKPRMASARAFDGSVTVYVVSQDQFDSFVSPAHPFVKKIMKILVDHVRGGS